MTKMNFTLLPGYKATSCYFSPSLNGTCSVLFIYIYIYIYILVQSADMHVSASNSSVQLVVQHGGINAPRHAQSVMGPDCSNNHKGSELCIYIYIALCIRTRYIHAREPIYRDQSYTSSILTGKIILPRSKK